MMTASKEMLRYRPGGKKVVKRFLSATAEKPVNKDNTAHSLSVIAFDREVKLTGVRNAHSGAELGSLSLAYESQTMVQFEEGRAYLLAVNGEDCIGIVELEVGNQVKLPDGTVMGLEEYILTQSQKPFPNYHGSLA